MVAPEATRQRARRAGSFVRSLPRASSAKTAGFGRPRHQRTEHRPARHAEDVAGDGGELEARVLEHLVQSIGVADALVRQRRPIARQVPEIPNRPRRYEAAPHEPVLHELRDPRAVGHIGLAPGNLLDVRRIHQHAREPLLEHRVDRLSSIRPCSPSRRG